MFRPPPCNAMDDPASFFKQATSLPVYNSDDEDEAAFRGLDDDSMYSNGQKTDGGPSATRTTSPEFSVSSVGRSGSDIRREANENDPLWLASKHVQNWMESFHLEEAKSGSLVTYLHRKLQEALRSSEKLGNPNEFRTAVCCHLLDVICRTFGRYSDLVDQLKMEIYASIYIDKDDLFSRLAMVDKPTASTFIDSQPYFRKVERLLTRKHQLEEDLAIAVRQRNRMKEELNKKQKVLDATAVRWQKTLLKQSYNTWVKIIQARKYQRTMLMKYFISKEKARLGLCIREWRLHVHTKKRSRAHDDLSDARDKVQDMESEREKLERERDEATTKIEDLKTKLESARKELAELDDEAVRVQSEISESKEEELTSAARAWADVCDTACINQMKALRNKLDLLNEDPYYADVTLLANMPVVIDAHGQEQRVPTIPPFPIEAETKKLEEKGVDWKNDREATVLNMPVDILLLRWFNFHLKSNKYPKIVENFGKDMQDSEELAILLSVCSKAITSPLHQNPLSAKLKSFDLEARAEELVGRMKKMGTPPLMEVEDIVLCVPDMIFAGCAYLFCNYPQLQPNPRPWVIASDALDRATKAWLDLKERWTASPVPPAQRKTGSGAATMTPVDEVEIKRVGQQVLAACTAAKHALARHERATKLYERVRLRVRNFAWDAMNKRADGKPIDILDRRDHRERQAFTALRIDKESKKAQKEGSMWHRFSLEKEPEEEIQRISALLNEYYDDIKLIYRHYSTSKPGSSGTIDLAEFGMLMYDIKLPSKTFPTAVLENIFKLTNRVSESSKKVDMELNASEFVEVLLRVASKKYERESVAYGQDTGRNKLKSFSELTRSFFNDNLIPFACRSDAERFRQELQTDEVKAVFRKFRDPLQRIFGKYSKGDGAMDANEFLKFVRDRQLINNSFSEQELHHVFNKVQDEEGAFYAAVGNLGLDDTGMEKGKEKFKMSLKSSKLSSELNYMEFIEGIAAIAIFKDPDPYVPLKQKIEHFLTSEIVTKGS